jgi:hypothetical protein
MKQSDLHDNQKKDEIVPPAQEANILQRILKWALASLPLGGVVWTSFLPLPPWMRQALVLITLLWFFIFYLLDTFFLNG